MESQRPSNTLLILLAASLALAGWFYGRPLLFGSEEPPVDEGFIAPNTLGFSTEDDDVVERWSPPLEPRDPFLPVDVNVVSDEPPADDGDGDTGDESTDSG